jgi:hypothetical protein
MRKNRILGLAVATALSLPMGVAQAGTFENVENGTVDSAFSKSSATVVGETAISMSSSEDGGVQYALELFGGTPSPTKLPNDETSSSDWAAAQYVVDGTINVDFNVEFTLDGAKFAADEHPRLGMNTESSPSVTFDGGGKEQSTVQFTVTSVNTDNVNDGEALMFLYRLGEAGNLATKDGQVKLSISLKDTNGVSVNSGRQITVATAKESVTVKGEPETDGTIKISVGDDSKKFTNANDNDEGAFISSTVARIGRFTIDNADTLPVGSDGETEFKTGAAATNDGEVAQATIAITGGQFAASKSGGQVYVCALDDDAKIGTAANATDDTTATIELTNDNVASIVAETDGEVGICMSVDQSSEINTVENPPSAKLTIDYKQDYVNDIETTFDLRQISKDGTVCRVYLIPSTESPREKMNIRITNDSSVSGKLLGRLFKEDGTEVGPAGGIEFDTDPNDGVDKTPLGAGKTFYLNAEGLEGAGFEHWGAANRPMLVLTSTLPDLEVLSMMRHVESRYLFNMSLGATGASCER